MWNGFGLIVCSASVFVDTFFSDFDKNTFFEIANEVFAVRL